MSEPITTRTTQLAWDLLDMPSPERFGRVSLVLHWGEQSELVPLAGAHDAVVIGRSAPADVCVKSPSLSRQHARFTWSDNRLTVEDLDSLNGTVLAEQKVKQATLASGDNLQLGDLLVQVSISRPAAPTTAEGSGLVALAEAGEVIIESPAMRTLYATAQKLAGSDVSVLILGETGTGKEHLAHTLHAAGPRKDAPFRVINCGAIPDGLAESLLFGHERGAFTGAIQSRAGVFEDAGAGTVFLDEVGELPLSTQAKLLRVLEERIVTRVGGQREIPLHMRVVAATHCDLDRMVADKTFRQDLLYRLNTVSLVVPPLRDRPEEIGPLSLRFSREASEAWSLPACTIDADALAALTGFAWPGNIRHLRNVIERATLLCRDSRITPQDLPDAVRVGGGASLPASPAWTAQTNADAHGRDADATGTGTGTAEASTEAPTASVTGAPFKDQVQALETRLITEALTLTGGNQRAAAKMLRMPRRTLAYKIQTLGIALAMCDGDETES